MGTTTFTVDVFRHAGKDNHLLADGKHSCPDPLEAARLAHGHFRTAGGSEADVVLEKADGTVAAIEVKASAKIAASDFAALQALRDQLGKRFRAGAVLYLGEQILPFSDKLWLIPVPALWAP